MHGDAVRALGGSGSLSPARCVVCHTEADFCTSCHLITKPQSHRHLWELRHGKIVRATGRFLPASCQMCHINQTWCDRCHWDEPPRSHTNLFRTRTHGVMASIDRRTCATCHTTDFCVRCHEDTPPRSHRAGWGSRRNRHCVNCHFPIRRARGCGTCHKDNPTHDTAPPQPANHVPGRNCRVCHNAAGGGGAQPLRHVDNGMNCETCHR